MKKMLYIILTLVIICLINTALADESYLQIESFSDGLAAVQNMERLWGYIDKTGKIVIPCEYNNAGTFSEGIACVRKDWKYGYINTSGQLIVDCKWERAANTFSDGLAAVQDSDGLWGFIDVTGNTVIPFKWEGILTPRFSEGFAAVEKDNMMGYINRAGEIVIPCKYKYCEPFSHGYALVQDDEGLIFIDSTGTIAFPEIPHAIQADYFREDGIAFLGFEDHTGIFINTEGQVIYKLSSDYVIRSNFHEGLAGIAKYPDNGGCEGYIDQNGTVVIPLELYSSYYQFQNGRTCIPNKSVLEEDVHYAVIDQSGRMVYPFKLDKGVQFAERVAAAKQDGRVGVIDIEGNTVITFDYDDIKVGDGIILCLKDGKISMFDY